MGFFEFLLRGMSYPRLHLSSQCVNFIVCIYRFCFYDRVTPILRVLLSRAVHAFTCCPVETMAGPSEKHLCFVNPLHGTQLNLIKQLGHNAVYFINILLVDLAGVEPASRTLFSLLHTAITFI